MLLSPYRVLPFLGPAPVQDKSLVPGHSPCCPSHAHGPSWVSVSLAPLAFCPDHAAAPSRAKLPVSLGATEATYRPHGSLTPMLQWALGCGDGDSPPGAGFGVFGVPLCCVPRCLCQEQGWGWTQQQPAPGRKVCKESTEHRLPGVSEGKFMHRL